MPSRPKTICTGLVTVAPSFGSMKNTRAGCACTATATRKALDNTAPDHSFLNIIFLLPEECGCRNTYSGRPKRFRAFVRQAWRKRHGAKHRPIPAQPQYRPIQANTQGTQKPPGRGYTEHKKSLRSVLLPRPGGCSTSMNPF